METKLNLNDPYLLSAAGKKRKQEIIHEFLISSSKLQTHAFSCPVMKDGNFKIDCEICKKLGCLINIFIQQENNQNKGKLDVKSMVEKGIIEYMVFGDGIEIRN